MVPQGLHQLSQVPLALLVLRALHQLSQDPPEAQESQVLLQMLRVQPDLGELLEPHRLLLVSQGLRDFRDLMV